MKTVNYDREKAVKYAQRWAMDRNPCYYDFEHIGGDCTNFASQVLFAGYPVMNYEAEFGWYYIDANDRTPSWTGVEFLHKFLVNNKREGPAGIETGVDGIKPGDIIQLSFSEGRFHHSPVVVKCGHPPKLDNILIAAHSYDRTDYPVTNYSWKDIRFIHIK